MSNNPKKGQRFLSQWQLFGRLIDTNKPVSLCTGHLPSPFCCPIWPPRISSWTRPWNGFLSVSKNAYHLNI